MAHADNDNTSAEGYEAQHVHAVYEQIAPHFSSTRYKPWPIVERFLHDRPTGSIGVDIGCGNGKYLGVNERVFIIASDRSQNLAQIAHAAAHSHAAILAADALAPPHPDGAFDFALSIAVLHHLSTRQRRVEGLRALLRTLKSGDGVQMRRIGSVQRAERSAGRSLVFVWALEQKGSRRGWDAGDAQDVMVPWVLNRQLAAKPRGVEKQDMGAGSVAPAQRGDGKAEQVLQRYYHLYRQGELEEDIQAAGGHVVEAGYERDNWWAIAERGPD